MPKGRGGQSLVVPKGRGGQSLVMPKGRDAPALVRAGNRLLRLASANSASDADEDWQQHAHEVEDEILTSRARDRVEGLSRLLLGPHFRVCSVCAQLSGAGHG